jgi:hypothetical protein
LTVASGREFVVIARPAAFPEFVEELPEADAQPNRRGKTAASARMGTHRGVFTKYLPPVAFPLDTGIADC